MYFRQDSLLHLKRNNLYDNKRRILKNKENIFLTNILILNKYSNRGEMDRINILKERYNSVRGLKLLLRLKHYKLMVI